MGLAEAEALAYAIAPYVQLLGADIRRRELEQAARRSSGSLVKAAVAKGLMPEIPTSA